MKTLLYDAPQRVIEWAESMIPHCRFRPDAKAIGLLRGGTLCAGAIYDTFTTTSCFMHLASDGSRNWATREFLVHMFAFPFIQCGYERVSAAVSEHNADSCHIVERFGGVLEGRQRRAGPTGEDMLLFGLLREECKVPLLFPAGVSRA